MKDPPTCPDEAEALRKHRHHTWSDVNPEISNDQQWLNDTPAAFSWL